MAAPHDLPLPGPSGATRPRAPKKLKPTADKPVAPKKKAPRRPLTIQQQAQQIVANELNPYVAQQRQFSAQQNTAIQNFTKMLLDTVKGMPSNIAQGYDGAISTQTSIANAAADALRNANPNQQDQAILNAVGAPDSQHAQVASGLADTFAGGAAVGEYRNLLNTNDLQAAKLAAVNIAKTLPSVEGLRGHQALQNAIYTQAQKMAEITGQRPKLYQDALNSIFDQQAKQQQLGLEQQALGLKVQNQQFQQGATVARLKQGDRRLAQQQAQYVNRYNLQVQQFNARRSDAQAKASAPNSSLSGRLGYLVDSNGTPITNKNGALMILPGYKQQGGKIVKVGSRSASAKRGGFTPYQVQRYRGTAETIADGTYKGFTDSKGNEHPPLSYQDALEEMRKEGIPIPIAVKALNRHYRPGERGRPPKIIGGKTGFGIKVMLPPPLP